MSEANVQIKMTEDTFAEYIRGIFWNEMRILISILKSTDI